MTVCDLRGQQAPPRSRDSWLWGAGGGGVSCQVVRKLKQPHGDVHMAGDPNSSQREFSRRELGGGPSRPRRPSGDHSTSPS